MINRIDAKDAKKMPKIMKEISEIKRTIICEALLGNSSSMVEIGKDLFRDRYIMDHFKKSGFAIEDRAFFMDINYSDVLKDPSKCIDQEIKRIFEKYVNNPEITKHLDNIMNKIKIIAARNEKIPCINYSFSNLDIDCINIIIDVLKYLNYLVDIKYKDKLIYWVKIRW